jgi:hypothetical protein
MAGIDNFMNALAGFGAGVQGRGQEFLKQQALASLAPRIQQGDRSALLELATLDPTAAAAASQISALGRPEYKVQEIDGKLVRYNPNNPGEAPQVIFGQNTSGVNPKTIEGEGKLRSEFDTQNKDFRSVRDAYSRVEASVKDPSPAGDLALIFNYMKILDPGSTVREGEFANAQNAVGVPGAVMNAYNRALTGERLNPGQRLDFANRARGLYEAQGENYNAAAKKYRGLAEQYGYDPDRITKPIEFGKDPKASPAIQEGQTATNPKTGQKLIYRGGKWNPA